MRILIFILGEILQTRVSIKPRAKRSVNFSLGGEYTKTELCHADSAVYVYTFFKHSIKQEFSYFLTWTHKYDGPLKYIKKYFFKSKIQRQLYCTT